MVEDHLDDRSCSRRPYGSTVDINTQIGPIVKRLGIDGRHWPFVSDHPHCGSWRFDRTGPSWSAR